MLEVVNTIEVKFTPLGVLGSAGEIEIDQVFAKERIDAYKIMYGDLECIGWYSVRSGPTCNGNPESDFPQAQDMLLHKKVISKFCENPLMLVMNPLSQSAKDKKKLPLFLYELQENQDKS